MNVWEEQAYKLHEENKALRKKLRTVEKMLDEWEQVYSTDFFGEVTAEEVQKYSGLITRNSDAMGRFMVVVLREKIRNAESEE